MKEILIITILFTSISFSQPINTGNSQTSMLERAMKGDKEAIEYLQKKLEEDNKNKSTTNDTLRKIPEAVKLSPIMQALQAGGAEWEKFRNEPSKFDEQAKLNPHDATRGPGNSAVVPMRYAKVWRKLDLNPTYMSTEAMERRYQAYKKEQYYKWGYIILGICALIGSGVLISKIKK